MKNASQKPTLRLISAAELVPFLSTVAVAVAVVLVFGNSLLTIALAVITVVFGATASIMITLYRLMSYVHALILETAPIMRQLYQVLNKLIP